MKVKLLQPWRDKKPGEIVDVNENRATLMLKSGTAQAVETVKKQPVVETADKKPEGETADLPPVEKPKQKSGKNK